MKLADMLEIEPGITAIIGGGGKTTLMEALAGELCEAVNESESRPRVIICTTTKILPPKEIPIVCPDVRKEIEARFAEGEKLLCVAGERTSEKLLPPGLPMKELAELADYVLVEADGSKHLPLKAHAMHEPVIPEGRNQVIMVLGIDGIGRPIRESCHRPELYAKLTNQQQESLVTPQMAMDLVKKEQLATRCFINKVEKESDWRIAEEMAKWIDCPVVAGSLKGGEYRCLQ